MPLPTTHKLFIDVKAGLAYPTFSSTSPVSNPSFFLGDLAKLQIFFIEQTGLGSYPRQEVTGLATPGIRVAVGQIDASPTAGHFHLTFGGDTTHPLDYNITASMLETRLNQLASIDAAGDVTVSKIGDNYAIKFNSNGSRGAFTGDASALIPLSNVGISVLQEGDGTKPEIVLVHLQQNVAALATSFTAISASTATVSTLSAWDGSRAVYRVGISPDPKGGTFSLAFDADTGTDVSTTSIAVGSTALEVQNALSINALADKVTVQQVGAYAYDVTVTAEPDTGGLSVDGSGLLSFAGFEGDLDINTANAISYLDGATFLDTTLEVEVSDGASHQTVLQIPCTLKSAVIDEAAVNPFVLDPVLTEATADGRYLRQANDLSDLDSTATARTNLDVYSKAETDAAIAAGGTSLPLAGGTMTGAITFDAVGLQNINKGTFDNSTGGYNGISLTCAVGYELNWQGGRLVNWYSGAAQTLYIDSAVNIAAAGGLTFSDSTTQTTAAVTYDGGTVSNSVSVTASGSTTTLASTGITFPDSSVQTTAAVAMANVADCLAHTIYNVSWTGSAWTMTFQPINHHLNNLMGGSNLQIYSSSGTDNITGLSQSSQITFTTTNAGQFDNLYVRMIINGVTITSTQPINYP
jgi:hypothetical protein